MRSRALWWWIDRWRKSTAFADMTLAEQGAYRNLLDEANLRGGALPNDERILAKACGDALSWKQVRPAVISRFALHADGWHNETLDEVLQESERRSEKQKRYRHTAGNAAGNDNGHEQGNGSGNADWFDPSNDSGNGSGNDAGNDYSNVSGNNIGNAARPPDPDPEQDQDNESPDPGPSPSPDPTRARTVPLIAKRRKDAAFEGPRVYVPQRTHTDFLALRKDNERELFAFYVEVSDEWTYGARADDEPGADMIRFWKARYDERWPATKPATKPESSGKRPGQPPAYVGWNCDHVEPCANREMCENKRILGTEKYPLKEAAAR